MKTEYRYTVTSHDDVNFDVTNRKITVEGTLTDKIVDGIPQSLPISKPEHSFEDNNYCQLEMELILIGTPGPKERVFIITEMDKTEKDNLNHKGEAMHKFDLNTSDINMALVNAENNLTGNSLGAEGVNLFYIGSSDDRIQRGGYYNHGDYIVESTLGPVINAPNTNKEIFVYFKTS